MGLPVPAESVRVGRVSELHYHAKSQGTLDAGAFEATLREFGASSRMSTTVRGRGGRDGWRQRGDFGRPSGRDRRPPGMVLVDELESITEPGAARRLWPASSKRSRTGRRPCSSPTSPAASARRRTCLAVDGIEAVGLEDGELVVNRSPVKGKLARSTPELIVEKLADDGADDADGFYGDLLGKFE